MFHVSFQNRSRNFQEPISQSGLPMINVSDNAKISDIRHIFLFSQQKNYTKKA